MKTTFKILLVLLIVGLAYACYSSIQTPIEFDRTKKAREKQIIKELIDIRAAQIAYKQTHNAHAKTFDELNSWLENGTMKAVRKELELSERQLENGMTESKALAIVRAAQKSGNWAEAQAAGLVVEENGVRKVFSRDTTLMNAADAVFGEGFDKARLANLGKVPGTNVYFEMDTASVKTNSGYDMKVFEAKIPFEVYLADLNAGELKNLIDKEVKLNRYPGMKVGSLTEINNNAGNWE